MHNSFDLWELTTLYQEVHGSAYWYVSLGPLGIPEPSPAAAELIPDIMLIPLAAFDPEGHRIGYGAGHYDFTLEHLRKGKAITAVGVAFAVQQIKAVPALPHDVALDYVLTESDVFDFRSSEVAHSLRG